MSLNPRVLIIGAAVLMLLAPARLAEAQRSSTAAERGRSAAARFGAGSPAGGTVLPSTGFRTGRTSRYVPPALRDGSHQWSRASDDPFGRSWRSSAREIRHSGVVWRLDSDPGVRWEISRKGSALHRGAVWGPADALVPSHRPRSSPGAFKRRHHRKTVLGAPVHCFGRKALRGAPAGCLGGLFAPGFVAIQIIPAYISEAYRAAEPLDPVGRYSTPVAGCAIVMIETPAARHRTAVDLAAMRVADAEELSALLIDRLGRSLPIVLRALDGTVVTLPAGTVLTNLTVDACYAADLY